MSLEKQTRGQCVGSSALFVFISAPPVIHRRWELTCVCYTGTVVGASVQVGRHVSELAAVCRSWGMDAAGQSTSSTVKDTAGTPTN